MQLHNLKIKKEYYDEVVKENKKFEIRKNDRDFQVNDLVKFIDADTLEEYMNLYQITYVLKDIPEYGLDKDYCIFSIKLVSIEEDKVINWDDLRNRFNNFNITSPIPSTSLPKVKFSKSCEDCKMYKEFENLDLLNNEDDLPCSHCANDLINQ